MGTEIVTTAVDALKGFASGVAETTVNVFEKVCMNAEGGLSNLAIWGIVMAVFGLGVGLTRVFTRKVG